ncbi:MAG: LOG family protein [Tepidisphaeraceae bacterium]
MSDEIPPASAQEVEDTIDKQQEVHSVPRGDMSEVHRLATQLMEAVEELTDGDVVNEMLATSLKLLRDRNTRADLKLINTSMKELRYALKVFEPYKETRKISIFGSARTPESHADYTAAVDFGRDIVKRGWMVITGAGGGIMAAGHGGAGAKPSFGLAIRLPFEQATNEYIAEDPKLINFKYFFTRKLMFVRSSHAIAVFPGGFGTMDEGFEVLTLIQTGKAPPMPIVFVDHEGSEFWRDWQHYVEKQLLGSKLISPEDLHLYKITQSTEEALDEVTNFYRVFHSTRYVRDTLVMRLNAKPSPKQIEEMNRRFGSICVKGGIEITEPLPQEKDEPVLANLPRIKLNFNRREHGVLRTMINYLNAEVS